MKSKIVFAAMIVANLVLVATFVATSPSQAQAAADGVWCCDGTQCKFRSGSSCWLSPECQGNADCDLPEEAN